MRVVDDGAGMSTVPLRSAPGHLGMSSMRDWVEVAGGRLDVTSAPGEGTTVMFWLPADPEPGSTPGPVAAPTPPLVRVY